MFFMKNLLFFIFSITMLSGALSQDSPPPRPWQSGDFFVGVNSNLLEVSANSIGLSPSIGYAVSNQDMIWASVWYAEEPRVSTFRAGWQRTVYYSGYVGLSGAAYGAGKDFGDWNKQLSVEIGVTKPLWSWLILQPKISFVRDWNDDVSQFYFSTGVTFAIKLRPKIT